jgi:outer membrane protein assembly factor BamB
MNKYFVILSFLALFISGCKKDADPIPDKNKFALPVWQWSTGLNMDFNNAPIPAIDDTDNSYFFISFKPSQNLTLFAIGKDGATRWQVKDVFGISTSRSSSVILNSGNLYFYAGRTIYCYKAENGSKQWSYDASDVGVSIQNLIVKNGEVWFTHTASGKIILVKLDSGGNKKWSVSFDAYSFNMGMAAFGEKLYLLNKALFDNRCDVLAVSLQDGYGIWKASPPAQSAGADLSIDNNGDLYFSTFERELIALSGTDGSLRWQYTPTEKLKNSNYYSQGGIVILENNDIVFAEDDLICFDSKGLEKWRSSVNSWMSFTLGNNNILYGWGAAADVKLFAIDASTGEKLSIKFSTLDTDMQASAFPPALTHEGNIIMTGVTKIHCITSMSESLEENGWAKPGRGYDNNPVW